MSELTIQRQLTKAFIDTMPQSIVLTPRTKTSTVNGGWTWTLGVARDAQILRFVELDLHAQEPVRTQDGIERRADFILLGEHDAIIEVDDVFTFDGDDFTVIEMYYDNGWEVRAKVARHGG